MIGESLRNSDSSDNEIDVDGLIATDKFKISLSNNINKRLSSMIFKTIKRNKKGKIDWDIVLSHFECADGDPKQLKQKIRDHVYNVVAKEKRKEKVKKIRQFVKFIKFISLHNSMRTDERSA